MGTRIAVTVYTEYPQYPEATASYDGTNIARFWHDPALKKSLVEAIKVAGDDKDPFDFANFLFSQVNNVIRRRYGGQELQLESISVITADGRTVISYK